ncbi:type II secretion system protein [Clostridium lundense]|uniref:type II secretion system protein n=1 Tax=Clostridium lundense TaxID=319475 RepID=UPI000689130A|nr:prepilin-type N-terminal cleavage/methylation domain-containing protein [Clostridium lundense]
MVKRIKKGFTLVELLVVIAIIAILAAIIAPNAFKAIEKSKVSRTLSDMKAFKTAALQFYADVGFFPADVNQGTDPGFGCTKGDLKNIKYIDKSIEDMGFSKNDYKEKINSNWNGPYLDSPLSKATAWGGTYDYEAWASSSDNANGADAGIYITIHGVTENGAKQLVKQSPFEVVKSGNNNEDGVQKDDITDKKKVTLKIADWPNKK